MLIAASRCFYLLARACLSALVMWLQAVAERPCLLPVAAALTPAARVIVQKLASRYLALILPNAPERNRISKFFRN